MLCDIVRLDDRSLLSVVCEQVYAASENFYHIEVMKTSVKNQTKPINFGPVRGPGQTGLSQVWLKRICPR